MHYPTNSNRTQSHQIDENKNLQDRQFHETEPKTHTSRSKFDCRLIEFVGLALKGIRLKSPFVRCGPKSSRIHLNVYQRMSALIVFTSDALTPEQMLILLWRWPIQLEWHLQARSPDILCNKCNGWVALSALMNFLHIDHDLCANNR